MAMAAGGDAATMAAVGLVWGATNALMRRGALVWDRRSRSLFAVSGSGSGAAVRRWADLRRLLSSASSSTRPSPSTCPSPTPPPPSPPRSSIGEATRPALAVLGTALIVLGIWVCIS